VLRRAVIRKRRRNRHDQQYQSKEIVEEHPEISQFGSKVLSPVHAQTSLFPLYRRKGISARLTNPDPKPAGAATPCGNRAIKACNGNAGN
jgi:hypothetical protein